LKLNETNKQEEKLKQEVKKTLLETEIKGKM
jgi:hypothetical protein